jgi:hypothetical protein
MPPTVLPAAERVTYQPVRRERAEAVFARLTGRRSLGAAHQAMMRARQDFVRALEACLSVGAMDRVTWLIQPVDELLARRPVVALGTAIEAKGTLDGAEDGALVLFALHQDDADLAKAILHTLYRERTAPDDLVAAICARFGWQA